MINLKEERTLKNAIRGSGKRLFLKKLTKISTRFEFARRTKIVGIP